MTYRFITNSHNNDIYPIIEVYDVYPGVLVKSRLKRNDAKVSRVET